MAHGKVRALHPEFFSDDDLAEVSIPARLLFAGLWCFACDNGHVPDRSKQIKRWIYATDDVNVAELLRELDHQGLIERAGGWLIVPKLGRRQRIDWRYFKTCDREGCEKPNKAKSGNPERETLRAPAGALRESEPRAPKPATDGDGDGDGDVTTPSVLSAATSAAKPKRATQRPADFRPSQSHIDLAASLDVDLRAEWQQFCDHHDAKGSTFKDWPAALRTWIRNAAKFGRRTSAASTPRQQADADMFARQMARAEAREAAARGEIA